MVNEHNSWIPRDFWPESRERGAIVANFKDHPDGWFRRLTYIMTDSDVVADGSFNMCRVLSSAGLLWRRYGKSSRNGTDFFQ